MFNFNPLCTVYEASVCNFNPLCTVDKALERINAALENNEEEKTIFQALQSKEAKLPFLYPDNMKRYISELQMEREEGIPKNILVSIKIFTFAPQKFFTYWLLFDKIFSGVNFLQVVYSGITREMCVEILEKMK